MPALRAGLWFGSEGGIWRQQQEAQSEAARCLTLLTNCVLLWGVPTSGLATAASRSLSPVDEAEAYFEYFSPSRYEHLNWLGKYVFENPAPADPLHRRPPQDPGKV